MSDERLRELERRWQETGLDDDEARFLLEQVRLGRLSRTRLEVAARLDHAPARIALGDAAPPREPEEGFMGRLWRRTEHEVVGRLRNWPSGQAFELSEWVRHLETYGEDVALEAGRQLARTLAHDWPRLQRALETLRPAPEPEEDAASLATVECVRIVVETQDPEEARERVRQGLVGWALGRPRPVAPSDPVDLNDDDPISRLADVLLDAAEGEGEIRLHLNVDPEGVRGVARVARPDGSEAKSLPVPNLVLTALIARFKYLGGLDLLETERPQTGGRRLPAGHVTVETYQAEGQEACRIAVTP